MTCGEAFFVNACTIMRTSKHRWFKAILSRKRGKVVIQASMIHSVKVLDWPLLFIVQSPEADLASEQVAT
jgi:hypothetical protein